MIECLNCLKQLDTKVSEPMAVLCNGRGEHVVSADEMGHAERRELLDAMDRS